MIEVKRILCPVDFSAFSENALASAMKLASWYGAKLEVLHVLPPMPRSSVNQLADAARALTTRNLAELIARRTLRDVDVRSEIIESDEPATRILEYADGIDADLIVTGSHGRTGVQRVLLGSVTESLLHRAHCPMLVIPSHAPGAPSTFSRIVCAVDFSQPSISALAFAFSIAEEADATLTLLHVIELAPEVAHPLRAAEYDVDRVRAEAEADSLTKLRALIPVHARDYCTVKTAVLEGGVSRQILSTATKERSDLIVLGVHGRNAFDLAFFGSNSKDVIRQAECPVLVVPAPRQAVAKLLEERAVDAGELRG